MSAELAADARRIVDAAIAAADPVLLMRAAIGQLDAATMPALAAAPVIHVAGAGKAGAAMLGGLVAGLPPELVAKLRGAVLVAGDVGSRPPFLLPPPWEGGGSKKGGRTAPGGVELIPVRPPGRNAVTPEAVAATESIAASLRAADPRDALIGLWSGGGSAMLALPAVGVPLAEKLALTGALQSAGAAIGEVNLVRKHLSRVKGGRLAALFAGGFGVSFALSDVVGDNLATIASGPTVADGSTAAGAREVMDGYRLGGAFPAALAHLKGGGDPVPPRPAHRTHLIGSNRTAVAAAVREATALGYAALDLGSYFDGDTAALAGFVAALVRSVRADGVPLRPPCAVIVGGETTVELGPNPGKGGRNQEFALRLGNELGAGGLVGVAVISVGTDGEDGPTDAAGGYVDADVWARARPEDTLLALASDASYDWLKLAGGLIVTGPTGTNVADVRVILVV